MKNTKLFIRSNGIDRYQELGRIRFASPCDSVLFLVVFALWFWAPFCTQAQDAQSASPLPLDSTSSSAPASSISSSIPAKQVLDKEIAHWIQKLGDPSYAMRLQAESELERIGVRALDQLHQASFDPDPQIASQARFLVQSNQFSWAWETDPFHVRRILGNYTTAALYDKSSFIDQLHALENDEGLPALCRLIRYEPQGCLAKRAALLLLRGKPSAAQSMAERRSTIAALVDGAMSDAGQWVAAYASQTNEFPIDEWLQRIAAEKMLVENKSPESSMEVLSDLRRWVVEQICREPAMRPQALELARSIPENSAVGVNRNPNAIEFEQWALTVELPELVQEHYQQLAELTLLDPKHAYLLAESFLLQNQTEKANQVAEYAAARVIVDAHGEPRKPKEADKQKGSPLNQRLEEMLQRNTSQAFERSALGEFLIRRGRFDWAEKELRLAIKNREDDLEFASILNLTQLSQMLHELDRNGEAAEVLEQFAQRFEQEPMFKTQASEQAGDSLVSNYYLYLGDDSKTRNDFDAAREHYYKSIELSQDNVDAIIGLYRLPNESDERQLKRRTIQQQVSLELRSQIDAHERDLKRDNPRFQATEQRSLANQMNTLAWLISNTEGNFEEALYLSRKACALAPNRSAYLDTLAHCYAALDRYEEAVEQQRRAVALEPFQPSLLHALQEFESKLKSSKTRQ